MMTAGSVATDYLMTYPGLFADSFPHDLSAGVSASFLADELTVRPGGVSANISFGMSLLGVPSTLFAAVGKDFSEYRRGYVERAPHVRLEHLLEVGDRGTARFTCTTDADHNQLATFYPGAMSAACEQSVAQVHSAHTVDVVIVSPNDPAGMLRHTCEAHELGIDVAADPSQQVSFMDADTIDRLTANVRWLFCNAGEARLMCTKLGISESELVNRAQTTVITDGADGATLYADGGSTHVRCTNAQAVIDPTGAGDSWRAGFFAAVASGIEELHAASVGSVLSSFCVEVSGPQSYTISRDAFAARLGLTFGDDALSACGSLPLLAVGA